MVKKLTYCIAEKLLILQHDLLLAIADIINGITLQAKWSCDEDPKLQTFAKETVQG